MLMFRPRDLQFFGFHFPSPIILTESYINLQKSSIVSCRQTSGEAKLSDFLFPHQSEEKRTAHGVSVQEVLSAMVKKKN